MRKKVPRTRLELAHLAVLAPEASASTSSAIWATTKNMGKLKN